MNWIVSLEKKFGNLAIPGLMRYVAMLNALVFILYKLNPMMFRIIDLDRDAVMHGQVWRLVSYLFIPVITNWLPTPDWFNAATWCSFLWWIGDGVEAVWGSFKLTLFYAIGMVGTTIAAFFFGGRFSNFMLNESVFFAFARYFPDVVIYIFYVLPMKVRWVAWGTCAVILAVMVLNGSVDYFSAVVVSLGNYLLFFGQDIWREAGHRAAVSQRRQKFQRATVRDSDSMHRCEVCNRTEISAPDLDFRVASDGHEYCVDHLPQKPSAT